MRGEIKELLFHQTYLEFVQFFSKQILTKQRMASMEISYQLLVPNVPELLRFGEWTASLRARSLVRVRGKMTSPHTMAAPPPIVSLNHQN